MFFAIPRLRHKQELQNTVDPSLRELLDIRCSYTICWDSVHHLGAPWVQCWRFLDSKTLMMTVQMERFHYFDFFLPFFFFFPSPVAFLCLMLLTSSIMKALEILSLTSWAVKTPPYGLLTDLWALPNLLKVAGLATLTPYIPVPLVFFCKYLMASFPPGVFTVLKRFDLVL